MSDMILLANRGTIDFFYFVGSPSLFRTGAPRFCIFGISVFIIPMNHYGKLESWYLFALSIFYV